LKPIFRVNKKPRDTRVRSFVSWVDRYAVKDELGNVLHGEGILLDTANTYVISHDRAVALVGVDDLIVVNDHDSLLICHKSRAQEIKKVVQALKDEGLEHLL